MIVDVSDPKTETLLHIIAAAVSAVVPDGWGFCVVVFPDDGHSGSCISTLNPQDTHRQLLEFIAATSRES